MNLNEVFFHAWLNSEAYNFREITELNWSTHLSLNTDKYRLIRLINNSIQRQRLTKWHEYFSKQMNRFFHVIG